MRTMWKNQHTGSGVKSIQGTSVADLFRDAAAKQRADDAMARRRANQEVARNRAIKERAEMIAKGAIVPK